ncbi:hypothetical protein BHE74_00018446 [Ensete ventricosum]|nr:hypothetical protein BHE74_00018446 [Ensete ventricosum]
MILLQSPSRFLLQILQDRLLRYSIPPPLSRSRRSRSPRIRVNPNPLYRTLVLIRCLFVASPDKGVDLDCHSVEFDDVRYHIQVNYLISVFSMRNPQVVVLSVSLPIPPPEAIFFDGLPFGAIEAIKAAYGAVAQILDPPKDGYNLTMKLNLSKLPSDEGSTRFLCKQDFEVTKRFFGFFQQAEKVTVVYPMRFQDSTDIVLATSFLQELIESRRTAGLNNAPSCLWSPSPPFELKGAPAQALTANAGFVTFVFRRFHAYQNETTCGVTYSYFI